MSTAESSLPAGAPAAAAADAPRAVRRVLANALALVVAYALPRVLTLGAVVLAARVLGASRFGAYGAAGAAAVILSIVSTAGIQPLLVREMARDPGAAPSLLRAAHLIKTALNAVMLLALWLLAEVAFGLEGEALAAALLLGAGYAIGSYSENLAAWFQAVERMHVWTAANAVYGIVAGVTGAALIWTTRSLPWFCLAMVLGQLAALASLYRAYRRDAAALPPARPYAGFATGAGALLKSALPFAAAFLALTVHYKGDVLILSRLRPSAEVGIYTAAYKLVDIAQALALAAIIASYPRLARAATRRAQGEQWAAARLAELALVLMAPAAAVGFVLREPLLNALYGDAYGAAVPVAAFLLPALVPLALNLLAGYVLAATHRMGVVAMLYTASAVAKLGVVTVVAERWGAAGVAATMLAAELLLGVCFLAALRRFAHSAPGARALGGLGVVVAACAAASLMPDASGGLARATLVIALVAAGYGWLDVLPRSERAMLRDALRTSERRLPDART